MGAVQTPDGGYVVSNIGGGVTIVRPDGARVEAGAAFRTPGPGVAMTRDGRVFVVDYGGTTVREILPDGRSRTVADGIKSPVGLVLSADEASLLTAAWSDGPSVTDGKFDRSTASLHRSGRPVHHLGLAARQTIATGGNDVVGEAERDGAGCIEAGDLLFGQANIEC